MLSDRVLRDRSTIKKPRIFDAHYVEECEPVDYQDAISYSNSKNWKIAIQDELKSHQDNHTWDVVDRPKDMNDNALLDTKWVFKLQLDSGGNVKRYKARLCSRGFKQRQGIDYEETYAPVVKYESLRVLFAIAAQYDLEMVQFDVKTAFLYEKLEKDIYIKVPPGLSTEYNNNKVCKLIKALYGLKQASRCWNKTFNEFLNKYGFIKCSSEWSVYRCRKSNSILILALFMDDGMIFGSVESEIQDVVKAMNENFEIKVGSADTFVGLQIERNHEKGIIHVHQSAYARRFVERFSMSDAAPVSVPADPGLALSLPDCEGDSNVPYREAIGSLMFLTVATRPDIAFAVNYLSRFAGKYTKTHWEAVKRVIKYLKGTIDNGLIFQRNTNKTFELWGYSDSDYAGCRDTRRSTSGCMIYVTSGPIIRFSRRQSLVTTSTVETEYVAACMVSKEII
ncbi:hypothetical protein TKK_0014597 [Trichogramma kaykai]